MAFSSLDVQSLPLILAGPILRRTQPDQVTVWVALKAKCEVQLGIYELSELDEAVMKSKPVKTLALGEHLHIVAVTASVEEIPLTWGQEYAYNLFFSEIESPDAAPKVDLLSPPDSAPTNISDILYDGRMLPGFVLTPEDLGKLRIVHASCRKPHGNGADMLAHLDTLLEGSVSDDQQSRPHLLFLTGDQIYADDVSTALLAMLRDVGDKLLGWNEVLFKGKVGGAALEVKESQDKDELEPGSRDDLVEEHTGFTAAVGPGDGAAANHLMKLGEFYAMYLFAWSPVLWPVDVVAQAGDEEAVLEFFTSLPKVRRAMANTPTYMMFDDHEITDDWYLHLEWCLNVLEFNLGRRILINGMLAFALFQAWGNTPERFQEGAGKSLRELVRLAPDDQGDWHAYDDSKYEEFYRLLGLPDPEDLGSDRHLMPKGSESLHWHYQVDGQSFQVLVLDTRTWRWFSGKVKDPPILLGELDLDPHFEDSIPNQIVAQRDGAQITFVISPAPVINIPWIVTLRRISDWFWFYGSLGVSDRGTGDLEDWELSREAVPEFFDHLVKNGHRRGVILSGDVHYGYAAQIRFSDDDATPPRKAEFVQFVSSPLKNQDWKSGLAHEAGYAALGRWLPEPERYSHPTRPNLAYRVEFIADRSITEAPVEPGQPASLAEWMNLYAQKAAVFARNFVELNDGKEAIGVNNLAEVTLDWGNGVVVQKLWWRKDGDPAEELRATTYEVTLPALPDDGN